MDDNVDEGDHGDDDDVNEDGKHDTACDDDDGERQTYTSRKGTQIPRDEYQMHTRNCPSAFQRY